MAREDIGGTSRVNHMEKAASDYETMDIDDEEELVPMHKKLPMSRRPRRRNSCSAILP